MNRIRIALPPVLFFSLLTLGYAQPQDSGQQPDSPKQEETKRPEDAAPAHKPSEEKPRKPDKPDAPKPPKDQPKDQPRAGQEERQENHGQAEHGQAERGDDAQKRQGGKGAHAPDAQFKAKLGHQHSFKVNRVVTQTTVVPNQTQFVYEGYSFVFLDAWPADWMFTDDCYIDYVDDQYFLFDPLHPEVRVALLIAE